MLPPPKLARVAGLLYVISAAGAGVPELVRSTVVVPGDAAATAGNLRESETLFRLIFAWEAVSAIPWLILLMTLYLLLRHVNQLVAGAMVLFAAVGTAVGTLNLLNEYTALTIATDHALGAGGADALTLLFATMHDNGFILNAVFYGPWLVPLGYLVIRSGYFPKLIGALLIISCVAYLAVFLTVFLPADPPGGVRNVFTLIAGVGEIVFMLWLLVRGARVPAEPTPGYSPAARSR